MQIYHTPVSSFGTNVYFYYDEDTLEAAVIDPGGDLDKLKTIISEYQLKLKYILLTHGHFDHIGAVNALREETGALVLAFEGEAALLRSTDLNESARIGRHGVTVECDRLLKEDDAIDVGAGRLHVIHTPGHTSGGVCFYDRENSLLFSGDTLFRESVGRYDLATSNGEALFEGIRNKLFKLPDETKVLPGHSGPTTIGWEKIHNPIVGSGR